jgi:hypothetical protein
MPCPTSRDAVSFFSWVRSPYACQCPHHLASCRWGVSRRDTRGRGLQPPGVVISNHTVNKGSPASTKLRECRGSRRVRRVGPRFPAESASHAPCVCATRFARSRPSRPSSPTTAMRRAPPRPTANRTRPQLRAPRCEALLPLVLTSPGSGHSVVVVPLIVVVIVVVEGLPVGVEVEGGIVGAVGLLGPVRPHHVDLGVLRLGR